MAKLAGMSTKYSSRSAPQRRPGASTRRRKVRGLDPRDRGGAAKKQAREAQAAPTTWGERVRRYAPSASAPLVVLALAVVAVCFAVLLGGGWSLSYLPAAIGQTWLTLHAVPMHIDGVELGVVPLLPAIGIVALVASRVRAATKDRVSVLDLAAILGLLTLTSLVLSAIALFMVHDASNVYAIAAPGVAVALLAPLGLHLIGFVFGLRPVVWRALARRCGVPELAVDTCGQAVRLLRDLLIAALAVYLVALAAGYSRISGVLDAYPHLGFGGGTALVLVCLAYLPNAAVATLAVLLGGSAEFGAGSLSLFDATAVPLPPLPLLAAVPASVTSWAPVLMLVPAAIAVRFAATRSFSLIDAAAAATWAAALGAIVAAYASGTAGAYGFVGVNAWVLALAIFAWTGITCLCAWLVSRLRSGRGAETGEGEEG